MGKNYVIINNIKSDTFPKLLIEELPPMQLPQKKVEEIEVEGMDGVLTITDNFYMNPQKSIKCKLIGGEDIDSLALWLSNCEEIIFSHKPDRYYKAKLKNQIDFERNILQNRGFIAVFDCQPFGYLIDNSMITITSNNKSFNGKGTHWSEPIIKVYGSGTINLTINDNQITLKDVVEYITVDSSKKRTYKDLNILNNKKIGDFPRLSYGKNTISWTGTVTKIEIIPNWRYLI